MWLIERLAGVRERLRRPSLQMELGYQPGEDGQVYLERLKRQFPLPHQQLILELVWNISVLGALAQEWEETGENLPGSSPALVRSSIRGIIGLRQDLARSVAEPFRQASEQIVDSDDALVPGVARWLAGEWARDLGSEKRIMGKEFFRLGDTVYVMYPPQIMATNAAKMFESYLPFCGMPNFLAGEIRAAVLSDWSNGAIFWPSTSGNPSSING